jgi:CheY-like chemotaxis protein
MVGLAAMHARSLPDKLGQWLSTGCGVRCLIVDDSANFSDAAARMLQRGGITVVAVASNSADALSFSRDLTPDVILLDVELGGESGFDLAEELHRSDLPGPPAVILISTYAEQDLIDMIRVSPAVGFLPKFALSANAVRDMVTAPRGR